MMDCATPCMKHVLETLSVSGGGSKLNCLVRQNSQFIWPNSLVAIFQRPAKVKASSRATIETAVSGLAPSSRGSKNGRV